MLDKQLHLIQASSAPNESGAAEGVGGIGIGAAREQQSKRKYCPPCTKQRTSMA